MVQEAAVQAGPKRDLWYWNSILKTWNAKGLRTVRDVRGPAPVAGASRNIRVDRETPSGNDFLQGALDRPPPAQEERVTQLPALSPPGKAQAFTKRKERDHAHTKRAVSGGHADGVGPAADGPGRRPGCPGRSRSRRAGPAGR